MSHEEHNKHEKEKHDINSNQKTGTHRKNQSGESRKPYGELSLDSDDDIIDSLLSGKERKEWREFSDKTQEETRFKPDTLISEAPEAVLHEGETLHYFECPDCGYMIEVKTTERPLEVECSSCSNKFRLKGKPKEEENKQKDNDEKEEDNSIWEEKSRLSEMAMVSHRNGEIDKAIEIYDKILGISENDPVVWNNKGVALDSIGMHISAVKHYHNALKIRKNYVDAWFNLAYSQFRMKQYEKSTESLKTLLRFKPDHEEAHKLIDRCEEKLRAWKKFIE